MKIKQFKNNKLIEQLEASRKEQGLNYNQIAVAIQNKGFEIKRQTVNPALKNERATSLENIMLIADALGFELILQKKK